MKPQFYEQKFRKCIPPEMLAQKRWVRYFLKPKPEGGSAKIPLGNHSDSSTWETFNMCAAMRENGQGIGYCFLGGDIQALDIDHCRNPKTGMVCDEAQRLLSRLPSWAEYSVSGQGIHLLFKGNVRGKQLGETHLQFWNSKNSPRFFALTCDLVGEAFSTLKDIGEEFNYVFATARHISAKIREELKAVDYEQWEALPAEREVVEPVTREKGKHKSRKVAAGFDIKDFLAFYGLQVDNETDNELGHCIRLTSCPIKGEAHAGHNGTTCNFIYPCKDGGLAYHCQSTGCCEYGIKEALDALVKQRGPYPNPIYEDTKKPSVGDYSVQILTHTLKDVKAVQTTWLVEGRLAKGILTYMFAPKGRGKTKLYNYWNKLVNDQGLRVIRFNMEDSEDKILKPCLQAAGYNVELTEIADKAAIVVQGDKKLSTAVNFSDGASIAALRNLVTTFGDVGLVIIEPINNYKGKARAISEDEMRPIYQNLANLAEELNICILAISHTNRKKDVDVQEKSHGAGSSIHVARINWFLDKDPNGGIEDKLLSDAGSNIPVGKSLAFKITQVPPFELDGITFDKVAIATNFEDSDVTAEQVLEDGESPARKSKANAIAAWLVEFMLGKGAMDSNIVVKAGHQVNKEWSEDNIRQVLRRRKKNLGATSSPKGTGKATTWEIGNKQASFDAPEAA